LGDGDKGIDIAYGEVKTILFRARIFKLLRRQEIDSQESIPPAYENRVKFKSFHVVHKVASF
jgi:hypothetical protein